MPNWKDALLKSSLPLEQVVMETLELSSFCVAGPYSYSRLDDSATGNEFSVDLAASRELTGPDGSPLAVLHILVECKYQYPGVRWIFSASAAGTPAVAGPIAHVSDTDTGKMSGANALLAIEDALPYCTRGVVLHEGGVDSNTIDHGLGQLRYAIPHQLRAITTLQMREWNEKSFTIRFVSPLLVTNAPLYVLKRGLTLDSFQAAADINSIADNVSALIAHQPPGPALQQHLHRVVHQLEQDGICKWLQERFPLTLKKSGHLGPLELIEAKFLQASHNSLVINLGCLTDMIGKLRAPIERTLKDSRTKTWPRAKAR